MPRFGQTDSLINRGQKYSLISNHMICREYTDNGLIPVVIFY